MAQSVLVTSWRLHACEVEVEGESEGEAEGEDGSRYAVLAERDTSRRNDLS